MPAVSKFIHAAPDSVRRSAARAGEGSHLPVLAGAKPPPAIVGAVATGRPGVIRSDSRSLGSPSMKRLLLLLAFVGLATVAVRQLKSS